MINDWAAWFYQQGSAPMKVWAALTEEQRNIVQSVASTIQQAGGHCDVHPYDGAMLTINQTPGGQWAFNVWEQMPADVCTLIVGLVNGWWIFAPIVGPRCRMPVDWCWAIVQGGTTAPEARGVHELHDPPAAVAG